MKVGVTINGKRRTYTAGTTILGACRQRGIAVPALCHDDRLEPTAGCRLCVVAVSGFPRPMPACNTPLSEGMEIQTHSPEIEELRRSLLTLLAREYPADAVARWPDKPFHHWLKHYGISCHEGTGKAHAEETLSVDPALGAATTPRVLFRDGTHPYIHVDMARCITCFRCVRICDEVQGQFVWRAWHRGDATRLWPDRGDSLKASSCVSCGACVDTCPSGALEDQSTLAQGTPQAWTRTVCPYCGTGCEMLVGTRQGRITQVKPLLSAPVSKGHLCVKGRYAFDFVHAEDRVTEPMIREHDSWRTVSWAEAIDYVASRLRHIVEEYGPDAVGLLGSSRATNEENYLTQKFARVVLGTNNVDCCARVCHAPSAAGMSRTLGTGAATNSFDDIERAATILICGCNPTENHPIVGARIKQAAWHGAQLIVIDPRQIELAGDAVFHLRLRPGTNIPLLNALAHVVVEEGLTDKPFLRERVQDLDAFGEFIGQWTPERAAGITGVPASLIREAARLYATHRPAICFHGLGLTEHVQGTEGVMSLVNLALLTGNVGVPGGGVNPLRGQNNVQGAAHMGCAPDSLTGGLPLSRGRELFEAVWQKELPVARGLNLMEMIDAARAGRLKALWAIGYDVALTNPEASATNAALAQLELVVVQDLFLNQLARQFAHVFLPACSSFEKDGTFMNSERRLQRVRAVLKPLGQSKPDWEILCAMAGAMGCQAPFAFRSAEEIWNEIRTLWKAGAGITYARLDQGGLQWPCPDEQHSGTTILHAESFPSGLRAPLQCIDFAATVESVSPEYPFLLTTGRNLYQFNAGTMTLRTPNVELQSTDTLDMAPADALRLGWQAHQRVRVRSRYGAVIMPLRIDARVKPGELFATFHTAEVWLNQLTGPHRDKLVMTPEYKVVAVSVERE